MLPFLKSNKKQQDAGVIIKHRAPDQKPEADDSSAPLEACAQEIIDSIQAGDAKRLADAIKDAFQIMELEPHEEGEHIEPHSYDASKSK